MARTAVVAGTATAVSGRVARRQAERLAPRDQAIAANRGAGYAQGAQSYYNQTPPQQQYAPAPPQYAPAPPPPPAAAPAADPTIQKLQELAALKEQGILTEEEFASQKARILGL